MIPPCSGGRSSSCGAFHTVEQVLDGGEDPLVERDARRQRAGRLDAGRRGR